MPHLLQHHPSGKLPQASKDRSFLQVQLWPSLDSLLAPSDSAKEAVECAGLGPRLCVFQATDKRKALEETMAFTTQALASVAYQVGNLAGHTLRMLDLQGAALRQVEAKMSTLGQMVNMHMEKVARREIGTLATVVRLPSNQKVIPPESLPSLTPYHRKPLNFACLDDIGHGVKDLSTQLSRTGTLSRKSIKAPATPVSATLGRPPRIPEPVQLPAVPDGKLSAASSASSLASAGSAEGASGIPQSKGQVAPATPPPPPVAPVTPPPPPLSAEVFLPPPPLEVSQPPLVVTLYPYTRQKDNELSFSEGTVICVTRRYSDGWCEGVSSEGTGFFPGNYVEPSC
ncbi:ABI gene family member 3 isoform X5 [Mus musculus]|uniref:ABI gene family member 3 isoform X5 n=1 Tax=Mus musculus TaxID=10090 RepID=UPI0003D74D7A|nr:ABI gene family member 3 isoform X5 [Mus musculus]|eukprot:XP_006534019.1 PREDICTED: ABI gene family member 3 isoform X4 [Mus musculus]